MITIESKLVEVAIKLARNGDHKQRVGCIIFDKKKILSTGHNHCQRSVKKLHSKFQRWKGSIHAEVDAIIHAMTDLKGTSLLVVRINKKEQLRLAKPCQHCMKYIRYVGIKKVYFSTSSYPYIECMKTNKLRGESDV
jgi:deoxycytidylate deaminase